MERIQAFDEDAPYELDDTHYIDDPEDHQVALAVEAGHGESRSVSTEREESLVGSADEVEEEVAEAEEEIGEAEQEGSDTSSSSLSSSLSVHSIQYPLDSTTLAELQQTWTEMRDNYHVSTGYVKPAIVTKGTDEWWVHFDYIADGAITKPPDGPNTKASSRDQRCLTCIRHKRSCTGTSIENGTCESCRAMHGGRAATRRICVWLDPGQNLWTYPDAHAAFRNNKKNSKKSAGTKNTRQSAAKVAAQKTANPAHAAFEEVEKRDGTRTLRTLAGSNTPNIAILPGPSATAAQLPSPRYRVPAPPASLSDITSDDGKLVIKNAAVLLNERGIIDAKNPHRNLQLLFNAIAEKNNLHGPIDKFQDRMKRVRTQLEVLHVLRRMKEKGEGLTIRNILSLAEGEDSE